MLISHDTSNNNTSTHVKNILKKMKYYKKKTHILIYFTYHLYYYKNIFVMS